MTFDTADRVTQQLDLGTTSGCTDDQRLTALYFDTGWQRQRDHYRADTGCTTDPTTWTKRHRSTWDHFDNGKVKTQQTLAYNTTGQETQTEHHDVGYLDTAGRYLNGHRTSDHFWRKPKTGTTCATSAAACDATYTYDARDRLTIHQRRAGKTDTYTFDEPARLLGDTTVRAGNVTKEAKADGTTTTTTRKYEANQLKEATVTKSGVSATSKSWYDQLGNLDCVTKDTGTQANCLRDDDGSRSTTLLNDYNYDYLNRLTYFSAYTDGTLTTRGIYTYDAFDRTISEYEGHPGVDKDRTTTFTYQGLTNLVTQEAQSGGTNPKIKTYSYDNYGHRLSLTDTYKDTPTRANTYTYGRDVQGSVSQLIGVDGPDVEAGRVEASYGYHAYGSRDDDLTTGDNDNQTPLNPYRYTDKRLDSATATDENADAQYDMGARRWGPATTHFLQQDIYYGALANLGLATDPLTHNTYALAGGNPITYSEYDGHEPCIANCDEMYAGSSGPSAADWRIAQADISSRSGDSGSSSGGTPSDSSHSSGTRIKACCLTITEKPTEIDLDFGMLENNNSCWSMSLGGPGTPTFGEPGCEEAVDRWVDANLFASAVMFGVYGCIAFPQACIAEGMGAAAGTDAAPGPIGPARGAAGAPLSAARSNITLLGKKGDIDNYMASKPDTKFDADFLNLQGPMAGGRKGPGGWTWTRNKRFIDDALSRGEVRLVTDPNKPIYSGGNTYQRELRYLAKNGYGWTQVGDYWKVIRTGR